MTRFKRATTDFYEVLVHINPAHLVVADRARLRVLLQELQMLTRKRSGS